MTVITHEKDRDHARKGGNKRETMTMTNVEEVVIDIVMMTMTISIIAEIIVEVAEDTTMTKIVIEEINNFV
jgi:hypothetical protein